MVRLLHCALCISSANYFKIPFYCFLLFQLTTVYVIIFLTGVIGNVIVCIVIVRHSTMHTATNYYLFSLAISDLMFLLMGKYNVAVLFYNLFLEVASGSNFKNYVSMRYLPGACT